MANVLGEIAEQIPALVQTIPPLKRHIFQDTKKPLKLWFKVGYLMLVGKKGISALQVHRVIFGEDSGSDYRTSWYMCMRWRSAMQGDYVGPLGGEVEVTKPLSAAKRAISTSPSAAMVEAPLARSP